MVSGDSERVVLAAKDIVVDYSVKGRENLRAVDCVSFQLHTGEIVGVVGESGSGKSSLGRAVAGFLRPTSGRVLFPDDAGELDVRPDNRLRGYRDVQMIFQESAAALDPRLPVWKLVAEALHPASNLPMRASARWVEVREEVSAQLERVGLAPATFLDKRPSQLSGGEKQRVAIARALAASPVALVCDESLSALDVSIRAVVLNLLRRLSHESGTALLFITHDISVVAHLADHVAVMSEGRFVEFGTPQQVIDSPSDDYTRRLIAAVPRLERTG